MSHQVIIIKATGGHRSAKTDELQLTYSPPDNLTTAQLCKEVDKRVRWLNKQIENLPHADAGDD